jgi:hypothetical protein
MEVTILGLGLLLGGLFLIGLGVHMARPRHAEVFDLETRRLRRRSQAEQWLRFMGPTLMGLGSASFGLIVLRYPADLGVSVSAGAPLIDHIAWALFLVGFIGGSIVDGVGKEVSRAADKEWVRRAQAEEL